MGTTDTISEIQNYLIRHQKTEDPIQEKSKERVTRLIAQDIKKVKEVPKGRCNICCREDDRLIPIPMNICISCCNKFIKRGGNLKIIKKENKEYHCDNCLVRTFVVFYTNPFICQPCNIKIGRTHKYGLKEVRKEQARVEKYKFKKGIKL